MNRNLCSARYGSFTDDENEWSWSKGYLASPPIHEWRVYDKKPLTFNDGMPVETRLYSHCIYCMKRRVDD